MKFDSPYQQLGFYGSPFYNNVFIMPTAYCLISIIEKPFLVLFLEDIEFVSIERIDNKIKTFDLAIIFKDYTKSVRTIDNIPKSDLQSIKEWMNQEDILFFEGGNINMNWDKYLKRVREDPIDFIEKEGGWRAFADESDQSEIENDIEDDDEFNVEEVIDQEEEDDEFDEEEELDDEESDYDEDEVYSDDDDQVYNQRSKIKRKS